MRIFPNAGLRNPGRIFIKLWSKRRFIFAGIRGHLRAACGNLRLRNVFQKRLQGYSKQIYALSALVIIALLEPTLFNYFRIFNVKPTVILAALVILSGFFDLKWSVIFALLGGILRDIFSVLPFGLNAILFVFWVILARRISRQLSVENNFIRSAMLCLIILLNNLASQSILFVLGRPLSLGIFLKIISVESIFTLLLALPMYRVFAHLFIRE